MYWNIKQQKRNVSATDNWLSLGGTAYGGTTYGPPGSAVAWGKIGCPLVPRIYRIHFGQRTAPLLIKRALKAPNLTLSDLDSELLSRFNVVEISPQISEAMRTLFYLLPVLGEVAIPSGIPVSWLTKLPLKSRLRNALGRYFWPHKLIVKEPLKCGELMAIPAVGKASLHELLCVLESAELGKEQAGNKASPTETEMTARILGRTQWGHAVNKASSEKTVREQDDTEHGEIQAGNKVSPTETEMTARILGRTQWGHAVNKASSEKTVREQGDTEHGEIQAGKKVSPTVTEMTARILGRTQWGHAGNKASSEKTVREQNEKEHGGIQAEDKVLPVKQDVYDNTTNSAFQKAVTETARQAIRAGFLQFDTRGGLSKVNDAENEVICSVSALGDLLREFVTWALAETDAQTIGDAISQVISGTRTVEEWQAIAEFRLNQAGYKPNHPYTILESWANHLPERERHIFNTRMACLEGMPTLQDLGAYFGVTRERVRQLEKKVDTKLTKFIGGEEGEPVRWRAKTVRQMIGVAAPPIDQIDSETGEVHRTFSAQIEHLLSPLRGQTDYREIVLRLAGPYDLINGWLVLKSAITSDPTRKIREMADEVGYIGRNQATRELSNWGLDSSLHEEWLVRDDRIRKFGDRLVRWDGSIGDKLVIALAEIGRPTTIEALLEYVQEDRAKSSTANALSIDSRAVRASRKEWALASWGLTEYSSIAMSIRHFLKSQEQPTSVEDVVTRLSKDLGMRESSIRAYCQAPMFVLEDGAVRCRRNDEPYEYDRVSLQSSKGVFALGPHRVSLLFEVDGELLRGSGRSLAQAAGLLLDMALNRQLTFSNQDGVSVTLTYPETSISGPSIGSLRPFVEASGARLGDLLTITLDKSDMSVAAVATDLAKHEAGWQLVSRLTGIDANSGMEGLAAALQCNKGEVRALLSRRGDEVVKNALPRRPVSSELDRALASLEAQLQQTKG